MRAEEGRTVGAIGYFDGGNAEAGYSMGMPETNTGCEEDGLVGRQLLDDFSNVCICEAGHRVGWKRGRRERLWIYERGRYCVQELIRLGL